MEPLTLALGWAMPILGGVVWSVRQEGRINAHTQLFAQNEKLQDERHEDLKQRLERIERKLDAQNGKRHE